jgi:hypothetical protein
MVNKPPPTLRGLLFVLLLLTAVIGLPVAALIWATVKVIEVLT